MRAERTSAAGPARRSPWVTLGVVATGTYFVVSDGASVNVAVPEIARRLPGAPGIEWVATAYLLALAISMSIAGWAADRFGQRAVIYTSMLLYGLSSVFAALAPTRPLLVGARVLQGLSSGGLAPVGQAYVYRAFPPQDRGLALGVWGMVATLAPAIGPVAAGLFVTEWGWRGVFVLNVPFVLVAAAFVRFRVPDDGERQARPFDVPGLALAAVAFTAVLIGSGSVGRSPYGVTLATLSLGGLAIAAAARRALRHRHPLIDLRILSSPVFAVATIYIWIFTFTQFAQLTLIPVQLQTLRGLTPLQSGLTLMPGALLAAATMPLGGRWGDRIGSRAPVALGMGLIAAAMAVLSRITPATPVGVIVGALAVQGLGMGLSIIPNTVVALNSLPARLAAQASVFRGLTRQLAAAVGTSVVVAIVVVQQGSLLPDGRAPEQVGAAQDAYNVAFRVMVVVAVLGLALTRLLPGREAARQLQDERQREGAAVPAA